MQNYSELKQKVGEYIASLNLKSGEQVPTEGKLCLKFKTTHHQVRKVLKALKLENGWVTIQGSGTYLPGGLEHRPRERVIAVVRPYFNDVIMQMSDAHQLALKNNFQFLVFGINHSQTLDEDECLAHLLTRRINTLIIDPHPLNKNIAQTLEKFRAQGVRVVLLNGSKELQARFATYKFNYFRAGYMALVHVMRQGVSKAIHVSPYQTCAWQHEEFRRGVDEAGRDFNIPVERFFAQMQLRMDDFSWIWTPADFQLPLEDNCGYIVDANPYEASYVQAQVRLRQKKNSPVIAVYHSTCSSACTTLFFDMRERMKWLVGELLQSSTGLPEPREFNPSLKLPAGEPLFQFMPW